MKLSRTNMHSGDPFQLNKSDDANYVLCVCVNLSTLQGYPVRYIYIKCLKRFTFNISPRTRNWTNLFIHCERVNPFIKYTFIHLEVDFKNRGSDCHFVY